MTRVKRGVISNKRRKNVLARAKGYRFGRSKKERLATEALHKAGKYAFNHRKDKKSDARRLWQVRISAMLKENGLSFSKFIDTLKKKDIKLDRKVLSEIAVGNPETFKRIIDQVK